MYDPPDPAELITAVRAFLEERAIPELAGHTEFHARVAANALGIVARQLELGPAAEAAAHERLQALLGRDGELDALQRDLARRIRSGELGIDTPGLVEHLRAAALDKLAVDQPRYSGATRAREKRGR